MIANSPVRIQTITIFLPGRVLIYVGPNNPVDKLVCHNIAMTIENEEDLKKLRAIGRIVYETLLLMKRHMAVVMTAL